MNQEDIWTLLDKQYMEEPSWRAQESATEKEIETAEKELELQFHHGYKKFLIKYGGGSVGFCNIYGLKRAPGMDEKINTVITNTRFYKDSQKWPGIQNWYIVSSDLSGNPIGMDSEGKVWLSDHDAGFELVKLADNFEEFLYKLHTDTLFN